MESVGIILFLGPFLVKLFGGRSSSSDVQSTFVFVWMNFLSLIAFFGAVYVLDMVLPRTLTIVLAWIGLVAIQLKFLFVAIKENK